MSAGRDKKSTCNEELLRFKICTRCHNLPWRYFKSFTILKLRYTGKQTKDFANALLIFKTPVIKYLGKKQPNKNPKKTPSIFYT